MSLRQYIYARRDSAVTLVRVNASVIPDNIQGDPQAAAAGAAARLRELTGAETPLTSPWSLGSGWAPAGEALGVPEAEFPVTELPGFPAPAVEGHGGTVRSYRIGEKRALVFLGRTHFYEGRGVAAVAHGVRAAVAAGCKTVVLTNGCGGLREGMRPGQPVLISDHINLTAASPIIGANFVDLTDLYSPRLRCAVQGDRRHPRRGRVRPVPRPALRDPGRDQHGRVMGGDLVGMSTVLEAIAAREAGAEVLGLSLVTNLAAGLSGEPLNHEEVLQAGRDSATRMGALLARVLERI